MFGHKPKFYWSPLDQGNHPETDTTEESGGVELNNINL